MTFQQSRLLLAWLTNTSNCICRRIEWIYRIRCVTKCCWQIIPLCNGQRVRQLATSFQKPSNDKSMSAWYASYIVATWLTVILFYRTGHAVDAVHGSAGADQRRRGGGGAPLKLEKIGFFGVNSWFFIRNTPTIFTPPSAIGKNMIFWRKIVIFHTKYPNNFRASLCSAQFF